MCIVQRADYTNQCLYCIYLCVYAYTIIIAYTHIQAHRTSHIYIHECTRLQIQLLTSVPSLSCSIAPIPIATTYTGAPLILTT